MDIIVFKKLLKEIAQFKKNIIIVLVSGACMSAATGGLAMLVKTVIDALQTKDQSEIKRALLMILAVAFVLAISRYMYNYWINVTSELITQHFRRRLQSKFMQLNLSFYNKYSAGSGGLISRILSDIGYIQMGLRFFGDFVKEPILFVYIIVWLFVLNWKLTLSIIILLPFILWFLRNISKSVSKYSKMGQEEFEKLTSTVKESLDGIRIIQSFNLESEMEKRYEREFQKYFSARRKIHSRMAFASPATELVATFLILGILLYMSIEISKGAATYGDFASYLATLLMVNQPLKVLQDSYVRSQETIVSAKRVFELLEEKSEVPQSSATKPFPENWKEIVYKNVSFSYGNAMVLKNVSFTVKRGQVVAFVGASGSGKSTIVNLLERFFDPTEGEILIDQTPIQDIQLKDLRKHVALVTQDVYLFSDTLEKNIWAGDFSKPSELVVSAAKSANADQFISKLPDTYQAKVGERGSLFSGGEKQRISIARAVIKDAPILILDEATSALDSGSEQEVQKGLDHLMEGRTALVIAHRLSTIAKADKIFVVKNGEIVEQGTQEELLSKKGEYFLLHQIQYQHA